MKNYSEIDVYDAATERIEFIFKNLQLNGNVGDSVTKSVGLDQCRNNHISYR